MTSFFAARSACTPAGRRPQLLAVEHRDLLQRRLHGGVALGRCVLPHLGHRVLDRCVHVVGDRDRPTSAHARRHHQPGDGRRDHGGEEHGQDDHEGHDAQGVSQRARMGYNPGS